MSTPKPITELIHEDADLNAETKEKDCFEDVGFYTTHDAKVLLELFLISGLRFQVDCDTGASGAFIMDNIPDMRTTTIAVHRDDLAKAQEIMAEWRKAAGCDADGLAQSALPEDTP